MYLDQAIKIFSYWERHPPTYQVAAIIAQMLGWKPQKPTGKPDADTVEQLLAMPPPGMAITRGGDGMPVPILDIEVMRERNRAVIERQTRIAGGQIQPLRPDQ